MAARKKLSTSDITAVWFAPENLRALRIQEAVDSGATPQEVADLASAPGAGEYREYLGEKEENGKVVGDFGDKLVWVHPPDADEGWFERHSGDDYVPQNTEES